MLECGVPYKPGEYTSKIMSELAWEKELLRKARLRDSMAKKKEVNCEFTKQDTAKQSTSASIRDYIWR